MVGCIRAPREMCRPEDDWDTGLSTKHVAGLRRLINNLVHRNVQKRGYGEVNDWSQARHRRTDCRTAKPGFRYRCVTDPRGTELIQKPRSRTEERRDQIFPHHDHRIISAKFFDLSLPDRPQIRCPVRTTVAGLNRFRSGPIHQTPLLGNGLE